MLMKFSSTKCIIYNGIGATKMEICDFYTKVLGLQNEELLEELLAVSKYEYFPKKSIIFNEGDNTSHTSFLVQGILRGYFSDDNGNEITDCIRTECGSPTVMSDGLHTIPSVSLETLTECEFISIPISKIQELQTKYIEVALLYNKLLLSAFAEHWEVKTVLYRYSALERYKWFLNKYPGLIDKISNKHIASYLNITAVTLSRLRSEISKNETAVNDEN